MSISSTAMLYGFNRTVVAIGYWSYIAIVIALSVLKLVGFWMIRKSACSEKPLRPLGFTLITITDIVDVVNFALLTLLFLISLFFYFSMIVLLACALYVYMFIISLRIVRYLFTLRRIAKYGFTGGYFGENLRTPLLIFLIIGILHEAVSALTNTLDLLEVNHNNFYILFGLALTALEIAIAICGYNVFSSLIDTLPKPRFHYNGTLCSSTESHTYTDPQQLAP